MTGASEAVASDAAIFREFVGRLTGGGKTDNGKTWGDVCIIENFATVHDSGGAAIDDDGGSKVTDVGSFAATGMNIDPPPS